MTNPRPAMALATCSYTEFRPEMGTPVRFTAGYPRWLKLDYKIAGWARLPSPTREILSLVPEGRDVYTAAYRRHLDVHGVDAIRAELVRLVPDGGRIVLLCFERLDEVDKKTRQSKWCHRTTFARWYEALTGEDVPELGATHATAVSPPTLF